MTVDIKVTPVYNSSFSQEEMVNFLFLMSNISIVGVKALVREHHKTVEPKTQPLSTWQYKNMDDFIDSIYKKVEEMNALKEQVQLARQTFDSIKIKDAMLK